MIKLLYSSLLVLLLSGCGYQLADQSLHLPGDASRLTIEMFENGTMQPYLENIVTAQITRRFLLFADVTLVENPAEADAVVVGRIIAYNVASSAYDSLNQVTQYRATMKIEAEFRRRSDDRILWRGQLVRFQTFSADPDLKRQDDLERRAQERLSIRLAEDLSAKLTQTF